MSDICSVPPLDVAYRLA